MISREKLSNCFRVKTRENASVMDFLALDNFDFTRKIVKKIWVKNSSKCWSFVKIEFLDKNLTFRIVWATGVFLKALKEITRV